MANSGFADIESERSALAENAARSRSSAMFRQASTPDLAATVSAVAEMYPNIAPSVIIGGALSGLTAYEEMWGEIDEQTKQDRQDRWAGSGFAPMDYILDIAQGTYGLARGAVRGGMIAFDTIWEEGIAHPLRTGVTMYQGEPSFGSAWTEASPSSGMRAAGEFWNDPAGNALSSFAHYANLFLPFADPFEVSTEARVNLGSGYFANSDLIEADDYRVRQLTTRGWSEKDAMAHLTTEVYGSPSTQLFREGADAVRITGRNGTTTGVSPGRLLATAVMEPGTAQFNVLSGAMDFGAQVFLDPSNVAGAWVGKARLASRAMRQVPDIAKRAGAAGVWDDAVGTVRGIRNTVLLNDVDKALTSTQGRGMLDYLSNTEDLGIIDGILSPATRTGGASNELLRKVQVTQNPDEMYDVIRQATGPELVRKPWSYSATSGVLLGQFAGGTVRRRGLQQVNRAVNQIKSNAFQSANYGGFQPSFRTRYMDGTILHDAATGRISRGHGGRNMRATGRLFSQMVGDRLDVSNLSKGIREIRDLTRNLDLNPEETQKVLDRFVQLDDGDINGALYVMELAMSDYRKRLKLAGVSDETVAGMTAVYKNQAEMNKYFVNSVGDNENVGTFEMLMGNGEKVAIPQAHTLSEMSGTFLGIPGDPRQIRRMTDFIKRTEGAQWWKELDGATARGSMWYDKSFQSRVHVRAADKLISGIWKPMVLMRPAWTLRVVGEEGVRMAAADLHAFNHPMRAFVTALGDKNLSLGLTTRRQLYKSDVYGDALSLATDYQAAMSRGNGNWFDSYGGYGAQNWIKKELGAADYDKWWFRELNQLQSDHVSNDLAKMLSDPNDGRSFDDMVDSFMDGELAPFREKLGQEGSSMRHRSLANREGAEAYMRSLEARIHLKTGGRYEVLKDDGWWYDDAGARLRQETASHGQAANLPTEGSRVRVKTRTMNEYHDALVRQGMGEDDVARKMKYLESKGIVDDAAFNRLDADARTVLLDERSIQETDILAEARTLEFRITEPGNPELIEAIATGQLRGANFSGEVNGLIEKEAIKGLAAIRPDMNAPAFVKGVDETDLSKLDNALDQGFNMFMGKQTNRYSRSPVFMREYWNTVADLADQGLIDPLTYKKLNGLLSGKGKTVTTEGVRRAMRHTEKMDERVSEVERSYVALENAFNDLDPELANVMEPAVTRLKKLTEGEHYDVGRYNRIVEDMSADLKELEGSLVKSLKAAIADEGLDVAKRDKLVTQLQDELHKMQESVRDLERLGEEALKGGQLDDLDIMYEAMGKMPEEYVDGLIPHPRDDAPSDLTDAIKAKQDEILRREPLQATSTTGVEAAHAGGKPMEPVQVKMQAAGKYTADSPWGEVKIFRTKNKGEAATWQLLYPDGMPLGDNALRSLHRTKAEAEAALAKQWDTLGTSRVYETRPTTLPGETVPGLPDQGVDIGQLSPEEAAQYGQRQQFTPEELKQRRADMNLTDEQIQALEVARHEESLELQKAQNQAEEGRAFQELLPERDNSFKSLNEIDQIAKAAALTATQDLLYDLSKRSNFSDMMRNIFPFAEAWWEIVSTWSRLVQGNPRTLQRFQQAYMGMSEDVRLPEGAFNIEGHDGEGFFYVDPRTKQEMFAIPYLSEALAGNGVIGAAIGGGIGGALGGIFAGGFGAGAAGMAGGAAVGAAAGFGVSQAGLVPEGESVDLGFSTQGVNMATSSAIPGISPLAAVPISWVIGKTPQKLQQPLMDVFMPFGEANASSIGDFVDSALPSYVKRFVQAAGKGDEDMQRIRANTTMEVAAMMVRRGEGSFNSPEEMKDTLDKASEKAGWLFAIRGLATFAGPTAPTFQYSSEDANGAWFYTNTMVQKWSETLDAHNGDSVSAFDEFTGLYGLNPQTYMTGKTKTITPHALTEKAYAWQLENEDTYKRFPGTAHLLNPNVAEGDDFSYPAYVASLRSGARVAMDPKEWAEKSNQLAANVIVERFQQSADAFMSGSSHKAVDQMKVDEQMHSLKMKLMEEYPGYARQITGSVTPMSFDEKLAEIEGWTNEMKMQPGGKEIMAYMAAREEAMTIGIRQGYSKSWWLTSPDAADIRDQVMGIATKLRLQNPSFRWAWTTMFAHELSAHRQERKAA